MTPELAWIITVSILLMLVAMFLVLYWVQLVTLAKKNYSKQGTGKAGGNTSTSWNMVWHPNVKLTAPTFNSLLLLPLVRCLIAGQDARMEMVEKRKLERLYDFISSKAGWKEKWN